jgi:hypothetical protein
MSIQSRSSPTVAVIDRPPALSGSTLPHGPSDLASSLVVFWGVLLQRNVVRHRTRSICGG